MLSYRPGSSQVVIFIPKKFEGQRVVFGILSGNLANGWGRQRVGRRVNFGASYI